MKKLLVSVLLSGLSTVALSQENIPAAEPKPQYDLRDFRGQNRVPPIVNRINPGEVKPQADTATTGKKEIVPVATNTAPKPVVLGKRKAARNDDIDGLKHSPAKKAVDQSTQWSNLKDASVILDDNGRINFIYGQSVPKIACAYLRVCSIELEPGETVNKVNTGDPVRWSITPAVVGEGKDRTIHAIIKPKSDEPGLYTNLKIATNRRMYDFDIFSVKGENFVRRIGFTYPENEQREWEMQKLVTDKEEKLVTSKLSTNVSVDNLNFSYTIKGDYPHRPTRVFDDGEKTYIQMGSDFKTQEAPVLVLMDTDGEKRLVNYRLKNGYYIVDKLFKRAALIIGVGGNEQKVEIIANSECDKSGFFSSGC